MFPNSSAIFEALAAGLLPERRALFQAGRYAGPEEGRADHIGPHDDRKARAVPLFEAEEGRHGGGEWEPTARRFERSVAVVLHLTHRNWRAEHGGLFIDYGEGGAPPERARADGGTRGEVPDT
jgi:hypothetical protein